MEKDFASFPVHGRFESEEHFIREVRDHIGSMLSEVTSLPQRDFHIEVGGVWQYAQRFTRPPFDMSGTVSLYYEPLPDTGWHGAIEALSTDEADEPIARFDGSCHSTVIE